MSASDSYKRFQDPCFQQLDEQEAIDRQRTCERFVSVASKAGYGVDDLLAMLDRGMSMREVSRAVFSVLEGKPSDPMPFRTYDGRAAITTGVLVST